MDNEVRRSGWVVAFDGKDFIATDSTGDLEVIVTTPLQVDKSFEDMEFEIHSFAFRDLKESSIFAVHLTGDTISDPPRIGMMIPINALGSAEHAKAGLRYFQQYAYKAIRLALEQLAQDSPEKLIAYVENSERVPFSDLFDDNVSLLVISKSNLPADSGFSIERIIPSLIGYGYVPTEACRSAELEWTGISPEGQRMKVGLTSNDIESPELLARLFTLAVTSGPSLMTKFFYLYQVFEYLMESVMRHRLPLVLQDMVLALANGTTSARDQYELLGDEIREKGRLSLLISRYSDSNSDLADLGKAASDFLNSLEIQAKPGVDAIYKVRNFLFHQARNLPSHDDPLLEKVVITFAQYLPSLLKTYKNPTTLDLHQTVN